MVDIDENAYQFGGYEEDFYKDSHTSVPILEDEIERSTILQHIVPVACDRKSNLNPFELKCFGEPTRTTASIHDSFSSKMNNFCKSNSSKSSSFSHKIFCKTLETRGGETQKLEPYFNSTSSFNNKYVRRNKIYGDQYFKTLEAHAEYLKKLSSSPNGIFSPTFNITESTDLNDIEISVVPKRASTDCHEYFNREKLTMHKNRYTGEDCKLLSSNCFDTMHGKGSQCQYEEPDVLSCKGSQCQYEVPDVLNGKGSQRQCEDPDVLNKETRQRFFDLTKKSPDMIKVPVTLNEVCPFVLQRSSTNLSGEKLSRDEPTSSIFNQISCGFDGKLSKDGTESRNSELPTFDVGNETPTLRLPQIVSEQERVEDLEYYNENLDLKYSCGKNQANYFSPFQIKNSQKNLAQVKRKIFPNQLI